MEPLLQFHFDKPELAFKATLESDNRLGVSLPHYAPNRTAILTHQEMRKLRDVLTKLIAKHSQSSRPTRSTSASARPR